MKPNVGDIAAVIVGMPGPDIDYGLCIERDGERCLIRSQVYQQPGPWHQSWTENCQKARHLFNVGDALRAERARLFPDLEPLPEPEPDRSRNMFLGSRCVDADFDDPAGTPLPYTKWGSLQ